MKKNNKKTFCAVFRRRGGVESEAAFRAATATDRVAEPESECGLGSVGSRQQWQKSAGMKENRLRNGRGHG